MRRRGAGGEADGAGPHGFEHDAAHRVDLGVGGGAAGRILAHDERADRGVAGKAGDIQAHATALQHREVFRDGLEIPGDALTQDLDRHALHLGEVAHDQVAPGRSAGRDGETAIADDRRGDAKRGRGRGERIPGELRVVVRVVVDDAGHQRQAVGIDYLLPGKGFADFRNYSIAYREIGMARRRARSVQQQRPANDEVVHCQSILIE